MNKPAGKIAIFALILAMAAVSFGDFLLFAAGVGVENSSNQPDASYGSNVSDLSYKSNLIRTSSNGVNMSGAAQIAVAPSSASQYSLVVVSGGGMFSELRVVTLDFSGVTLAVGESTGGDVGIVVTKKEAWEKPETLGTPRGINPVGALNASSPMVATGSSKVRIAEAARKVDKENFLNNESSNLIRSVELRC